MHRNTNQASWEDKKKLSLTAGCKAEKTLQEKKITQTIYVFRINYTQTNRNNTSIMNQTKKKQCANERKLLKLRNQSNILLYIISMLINWEKVSKKHYSVNWLLL